MCLQSLNELGANTHTPIDVLKVAVRDASIQRDTNRDMMSLHIGIALQTLFQQSTDGQRMMKDARSYSKAVFDKAMAVHCDTALFGVLEYGWAMLRKLHPKGPSPLWLRGMEKHMPDPDTHTSTSSNP